MASRLYHIGIRFSAHNSFRMQTVLSLNRNTASIAFFVRRTNKLNDIPAYLEYKGGGTRTLTMPMVTKIDGDTEVSNGGRRIQLLDVDAKQDDEDG